jgi:parallel beta-helix repeat protein
MLALLLTSMLTSAFSFQSIFIFKAAHANSAATRVEKVVDFLIFSQFDLHLNLCRVAPEAAPNQYWLVSDNLWAFRALKMANESGLSNAVEAGRVANLIESKLKEKANIHNLPTDSDGFPISFMHEAVIGDSIPTPNRTCNNITLQSNDYTVRTEICNGTIMSDWQEYADRLLYMALSFYWQANDTAANYYFELAKAMWDGIGINDTVTKKDGNYTTFKLALLLFTSKILGEKLPFELELVNRIWSLQRETDGGIITNYFSNGTSYGDANTETTSLVVIAILATQRSRLGTFAFYYPWYGTSGRHWDHITNHPLLGFYDSNNETLIKEHISMAKEASIDGFIVSWWGIDSFEDNATSHIKNVCKQNGFRFTIYYENTSGVNQTVNDIVYLLNNYANNSTWFRVDNRPVFYVYVRARNNLNPQAWKLYGNYINENEPVINCWMLSEDVRKPPRYGIFQIHPYQNGIGYIESANPIFLPPNETYKLKTAISDIRNDCPNCSDVGFRIKIKNETGDWETLNESIVNFNDGWLDLSFDISKYAGQNVSMMVESFDGGLRNWCSEWAAVDYLYIENSKGEIVSPEPFFDNGWKNVVDELRNRGFDPYFIMDFTGYQDRIQDFAEYFLNFTDGMHYYSPVDISKNLSTVFHVYDQASDVTHSKNKTFVATVMPGYNDTNKPQYVVDRQNGTYYTLFWSIAKACFPDGYAITSFNEWHEGTEIEPSLEYGYKYIKLTRNTPTIWTVDDDQPADFCTIQEAINTASSGDIVYVHNGTYYENIVLNKTVMLIGESRDATVINEKRAGTVIFVSSNNTIIKRFTVCNSGKRQNGECTCGIWLNNACDCALLSNYITNNTFGIMLYSSSSNLFKDNSVVNNLHGICLFFSSNNKFHHNDFIDNTQQVCSFTSENLWDDGYPSGGNYWSDYEERYPNATEIDDSGIWDTPYSIDETNQDNYPLIPEFPSGIILLLFILTTLIATVILKKKRKT